METDIKGTAESWKRENLLSWTLIEKGRWCVIVFGSIMAGPWNFNLILT